MGKLLFSYKNWELLYGISPFMLEPDKIKMREKCDGQEVDYIEDRDTFIISGPWGIKPLCGRFCLKKEGEADHTVEEIKKSPTLQRELIRLIRMDYLMVPYIFQMPAYIKAKDGTQGFAMVSVSAEADQMICHFSLKSDIVGISSDISTKMDNGLLDKYFSCYAVGVLETGLHSGAKVYLTSVDRLALCVKELTGKDKTKDIDYAELDRFMSHYDEVSPEVEREYYRYNSLITDILKEIDPGFKMNFKWDDEDEYNGDSGTKNAGKNSTPKGSKAEKIQYLRMQGYTIGQAAKKLGMSYQAVSKLW